MTEATAAARRTQLGPNELQTAPPPSWTALFLNQFRDVMVLILLGATAISMVLGEVGDAVTILAIVTVNAALGFLQEYRAERAVETLRALTAPTARVVREGTLRVIPARDVVPGDIIAVEAGDRVPADARLLETWALATDESPLTGESEPVSKTTDPVPEAAGIAERRSCLYMGTSVTRGRGRAVVVATGMATEVGRIAHLLAETGRAPTPLERRLEQLGRVLVGLALAIVAFLVAVGVFRGEPLGTMFLTGVSLAVAAIPEGLPALVTISLALGIQRMIRCHAIVRRLPAVETLGSVTVIASDKTGTLTLNRMTAVRAATARALYRQIDGRFDAPASDGDDQNLLARAMVLASGLTWTAQRLTPENRDGDPTEWALVMGAQSFGQDPEALRDAHIKIGEMPFDADRRRMAVAVRDRAQQTWVYVKGAPDTVLTLCRYQRDGDRVVPLSAAARSAWDATAARWAGEALRVLGLAYRPLAAGEPEAEWETGLIWIGLVGLMDPPRPEAVTAVATARRAGIRTVMITGDHPRTALAVAAEMGILEAPAKGTAVLTGEDLDRLDDDALVRRIDQVQVFARVSPRHKLRLVRALKRRGHVVAMTGDGVNDAPAIKEADVGIAMGRTGTDVAKEAAAMILADDNFATIVHAIREGRAIYDNIRKFLRYLLACNIGEVLVMLLAALAGLPLPLLPIQILLVNLATDGLPAMALGLDVPAADVMARPPRPPRESIFARGLGSKIALRGMLIGVTTLGLFLWAGTRPGATLAEARTTALATLVLSQLFHVFDARSEDRNFLTVPLRSNPAIVLAVVSSMALLAGVVYVPVLRSLFHTAPLDPVTWAVVLLASGFIQVVAALRYLVAGERRAPAWERVEWVHPGT